MTLVEKSFNRKTLLIAKYCHLSKLSFFDLQAALKIDPTNKEVRNALQNTKIAAKRAKRKDYYKILAIEQGATDDEIRKAYKKRALVHHPGK